MQKVGLLIINYNDYENTINFIKNVQYYDIIDKIVVVDNKSTDESYDKLLEYKSKKVDIVLSDKNNGYASAINIGCKYLQKKLKDCIIIVSNSDIFVRSEEDIEEIVSFIDKDISCVMPTVLENNHLKRGWKFTSPAVDILLDLPLINRIYRKKVMNYNKFYFKSLISMVDIVYGCFFAIDSTILEKINYFDENTFLYYEEYILARKLEAINKKTIICNQLLVIHQHNATIGSNVSELNKYKILKNSMLYYEEKYNHATKFQLRIFKILNFLNYIGLKIRLFLR